MAEVVQVTLRDEKNGRLTCNVDARPDVVEGNWITLKNSDDPTKRWLITKVYNKRDKDSIPRGWGMTDI